MAIINSRLEVRLVRRDVGVGPDGRDICRFIVDMPGTRYGDMAFAFECDWVAPEEGGLDLGKAALTIGADILGQLADELRATAEYGDPFTFRDRTQT